MMKFEIPCQNIMRNIEAERWKAFDIDLLEIRNKLMVAINYAHRSFIFYKKPDTTWLNVPF